jgi:hypothetical protein
LSIVLRLSVICLNFPQALLQQAKHMGIQWLEERCHQGWHEHDVDASVAGYVSGFFMQVLRGAVHDQELLSISCHCVQHVCQFGDDATKVPGCNPSTLTADVLHRWCQQRKRPPTGCVDSPVLGQQELWHHSLQVRIVAYDRYQRGEMSCGRLRNSLKLGRDDPIGTPLSHNPIASSSCQFLLQRCLVQVHP